MEWYYVWWPWLTFKCIVQVCQHQLSFLFYIVPFKHNAFFPQWRPSAFMPSMKNFSYSCSNQSFMAWMIVSSLSNVCPRSESFKDQNTWKSDGARSGEYVGWFSSSKPQCRIAAVATAEVWLVRCRDEVTHLELYFPHHFSLIAVRTFLINYT